jgi:excinuclease ABC subunit A
MLDSLGLGYLSLDRLIATLSGGESRRLMLAGQLGSGLTNLTYVLDEPTLGLHPGDTQKMMEVIRSLRQADNTVIIVEHDRDVVLAADHVIDIGPGAGKNGGCVIAEGSPAEIMNNPASVTGPFLAETAAGSIRFRPTETPGPKPGQKVLSEGLLIRNAFANNLKGFDLRVPAEGIIVVTGVSGSGKSSLLFGVIGASHDNRHATGCEAIEGFSRFHRVVCVSQRSGFSASQATPATYTGVFDRIRDLIASTTEAKQLGLVKNHFSFLNREGRCPACEGSGIIRVSMDFLPDVTMECEQCHGRRFRPEIMSVTLNGKNIADILSMTISEAAAFFGGEKQLAPKFSVLQRVGLGYLELGQALDTLSGGEAQRLSLAAELIKPGKGETLYLFDEPTSGLNFLDTANLLALFRDLAEEGNTLLVIEHNPVIIAAADHRITLGPEGGMRGGYLIAGG